MGLVIYNSRTRQKEEFKSLKPGEVGLYVCGPTVYDLVHVGNFRGAIFFNLVRNWLEKKGYKVNFVYNYTDIDDKIINRAKAESQPASLIAETYIKEFIKDFNSLKLKVHTHNPRVTEHLADIIAMIEKLIAAGHAYVAQGEVLYSIGSFPDYGKLSGKNPDELLAGHRVEVDAKKKFSLDFTLWKPAKPGEPAWPSPWGEGRPGWHIECSAMATRILGDTIDIHGGGSDLIFPHHENEVAQSEGATAKTFAVYWMHHNMLTFGSQKMSKSLGNIKTARAFVEQYNPEILKYLMLSAHYRSLSSFSEDQVAQSIRALARFYSAMALAEEIVESTPVEIPPEAGANGSAAVGQFTNGKSKLQAEWERALDDDFNTPEALAALFEWTREFNSLCRNAPGRSALKPGAKLQISKIYLDGMKTLGEIMALFGEQPRIFLKALDDLLLGEKALKREDIDAKVDERQQARKDKDFARADQIREELSQLGILVQDTPGGSQWEVNKS